MPNKATVPVPASFDLNTKKGRTDYLKALGFTRAVDNYMIGPELAEKMLRLNMHRNDICTSNTGNDPVTTNRTLNKGKAEYRRIVDAMREGVFYGCESKIMFDENGNMIEGQKRLNGIIETGVTVELTVEINAKHNPNIGTAKPRTALDAVELCGICKDPIYDDLMKTYIMSTAKTMLKMCGHKATRHDIFTEFIDDIKAELLDHIYIFKDKLFDNYVRAALLAAAIGGLDKSHIMRFTRRLADAKRDTAISCTSYDPIISLEFLLRNPLNKGGGDAGGKQRFLATQAALDALRNNEDMGVNELFWRCADSSRSLWWPYDDIVEPIVKKYPRYHYAFSSPGIIGIAFDPDNEDYQDLVEEYTR